MLQKLEYLEPAIFIGCIKAYNNGKIHGKWISALEEPEDIQEEIKEILENSPETEAEEWEIQDYSGFGNIKLDTNNIEIIHEIAFFIKEHGKLGESLLDYFDVQEAKRMIEDRYIGCYESIEEYAEQFLDDTGYLEQMPEHLRYYVDYKAYARDLEYNGDILVFETSYRECHLFNNY